MKLLIFLMIFFLYGCSLELRNTRVLPSLEEISLDIDNPIDNEICNSETCRKCERTCDCGCFGTAEVGPA